MLAEIRRIETMHRIDIIEAPCWDAEGVALLDQVSAPVITSLHTPLLAVLQTNPSWKTGAPGEQGFFDALTAAEREVLTRCAAVRANSAAVMETILHFYGIDVRPTASLIPHGLVDRYLEVEPQSHFVDLLYVGRLEPRKGVDVLFEVLPAICTDNPHVRFFIVGEEVGSPGLGIEFQRRHAGEAFMERISFLGRVSDEEVTRYYAACDIFVAPSRYESFGLIYLEAMMQGKPVIACRAGGTREVVSDGVNGLLADPGDPAALRRAIQTLVDNPGKRAAFGRRSRQIFLDRFTHTRMAEQTLEFYGRVLSTTSKHCYA
jgi:glycosyltransferase involved in cell wall biosynthesis